MFEKEVYDYLANHTLIEIKGGTEREKFTEIWTINVGHRLFSRSWSKSEKSWFTEFQKTGVGQIKLGEKIIDVYGEKIDKEDDINLEINQAYLKKYSQPENKKYAQGITKPEYADYTMEFMIRMP